MEQSAKERRRACGKKLRDGRGEYGRLIHLCRKIGDLAPLLPLTLQDVIWLRMDNRIEDMEKLEQKKTEMTIQRERVSILLTILSDLRHIQLSKMYFKTDMDFNDYLTTLPSFKGDANKTKEERRWKVRKRKPGEVPEWKTFGGSDVVRKTG